MHKHTSNTLAVLSSAAFPLYALAPLSEDRLSPVELPLDFQETIIAILFQPDEDLLPLDILEASSFWEGAEFGFCDPIAFDLGNVATLANQIERCLLEDCTPDALAFDTGFLLASLSLLMQTEKELALVGIAHFCYLLSFRSPCIQTFYTTATSEHCYAVKAFRACVRSYKLRGQSFEEAQRSALADGFRSTLYARRSTLDAQGETLNAYGLSEEEEVA